MRITWQDVRALGIAAEGASECLDLLRSTGDIDSTVWEVGIWHQDCFQFI
jgi:hypothetical protein